MTKDFEYVKDEEEEEGLRILKRVLKEKEESLEGLTERKEYYEREIAFDQKAIYSLLASIEKLEASSTKQQGGL